MSYDVIKKSITYDGEICFNWTYKNVRNVKRLSTSFAIDDSRLRKWYGCKDAMESIVNGTAKYPIDIVSEDFGTITVYLKDDCFEFYIYDGDTYSDDLYDYFEDGIQQEVEFKLNKKQTKEFLKNATILLGEK